MRAGSAMTGGVVATVESDVYMMGSLAYELLTGGTRPFHWLCSNPQLLAQRLTSADPVVTTDGETPDGAPVQGLLRTNVFEALELSKQSVPWCVRADDTPGSAGRLEELKGLVTQCLSVDPGARPTVQALIAILCDLLGREEAEQREFEHGAAASSVDPVHLTSGVANHSVSAQCRCFGAVVLSTVAFTCACCLLLLPALLIGGP